MLIERKTIPDKILEVQFVQTDRILQVKLTEFVIYLQYGFVNFAKGRQKNKNSNQGKLR